MWHVLFTSYSIVSSSLRHSARANCFYQLSPPPHFSFNNTMDINQDILRKQVMINQFCNQIGCTQEQATKVLQAARWQIEVAFSLFFEDHAVPTPTTSNAVHDNNQSQSSVMSSSGSSFGSRMSYSCVPANTPATPPTLPDTLAAFAQLKASSPDQRTGMMDSRVVQMTGNMAQS